MDLQKIAGGIGCDLVTGTSEFTARLGKIYAIISNEDDSRILALKEKQGNNVVSVMERSYISQKRADTVTLTGASGTANILCNGVTRTATFGDDLEDTAADFVTSHAAAYLAAGVVVTAVGAVLYFVANVAGTDFTGNTTITNATGDLAGTAVMSHTANILAALNDGKMIFPDYPMTAFTPAKGSFWVYYASL